MSNRKKLITLACMGTCLTGGGAVATAGDDAGATDPAPEAAAAEAAPVESIPPEQAADLRPLRRERTSDDALPASGAATLSDSGDGEEHWGANPDLSRRTAPGVWIVPGDGYVCVANSTPGESALGFGCATLEDVDRGLLAPSDVDKDGNGIVTGILPDGVATVDVVDLDGSTRTVDVVRNTYQAAIDADVKEVRFTGPDGTQHVLPMAWKP